MDIIRVFLISDFLAESVKANKKTAKKITHFTVSPKKTSLVSLDIESNMYPQRS